MASTTALFTGLSGLSANARRLDTIGNNIANVNTTAFKSNRMMFTPTFSLNFSKGTAPSELTGGTNPGQVGLGVSISGTQRNFNNGSISATGVSTDVAIEGDGFFIVEAGGERYYSRAGAFQRNESNQLVTVAGGEVMGFAVDAQFEVIRGNLTTLNIPVGTMTLAEASRNVVFNGNLNASGEVATTGSVHTTRAFYTDAGLTTLLNTANYDLTVPGNDLYIDDGAGGSSLAFVGGDPGPIITLDGVEKGGKNIGVYQFQFTTGTPSDPDIAAGQTLQDFMSWAEEVLGLNDTDINGQDLGGSISFDGATGQITFTGNEGTVQDLAVETADLVVTNNGAGVNSPFVMSRQGTADGESVRTSYVVYDSLGTPVTVDLTFVLQDTVDGSGTTWQFIAESTDNADVDRIVGLGQVQFDANGNFVSATNESVSIFRDNGAVSPLVVSMDFNSPTDAVSALTDSTSNLAAVFQDGSEIGTLSAFSIGEDGKIAGSFTNGLTRTIGQIAIAKFSNPEGLVDGGNGLFSIGPNSGNPLVTSPLDFGTGRLVGGALELSNVDLSQEFISMILASTGYSASGRVISTTDELIDQLLVLGR
jgi:flagellar hook protein FlgE